MSTHEVPKEIPTLDSFGARLALIRWQQRWNAKEAALACGLPQNSWREWELYDRRPRDLYDVALRISARTGVDVFWIMTGHVTSPSPGGGASSTATEPLRLNQSCEFWSSTSSFVRAPNLSVRGEGVAA